MNRHQKINIKRVLFAATLFLTTSNGAAFATTTGGLDTPTGVTSMPLAIAGTEIVRVTPDGLVIPTAAGVFNATALTTLVNLLNTPPCTSGEYLTKPTTTTFECVALPVSAPVTTASAAPAATHSAQPPQPIAGNDTGPSNSGAAQANTGTTMYSYISDSGTLTNTTQPCSYCGTQTSQSTINMSTAAGAAAAEAAYAANGSTLGAIGTVVYNGSTAPTCSGAACTYEAAAVASGVSADAAAGVAATVVAYQNLGLSEADAVAKTNAYYGGTVISVPASQ